ncbi:MAG: hypothetical protein SFV51_02270 [Bryobacteraceae bacterium]|nr:hypothetical protein [Bryobacteraceae bacterium]
MPLRAVLICVFLFCFCACESGPQPPAKGTPAFYWSAAGEAYSAGDFAKTNDHLEKLAGSADYAARAVPWRLMILDGLARGYAEIADRFETGARVNKTSPAPFRRQASDMRSAASRLAMGFAESLQQYEKANPSGEVTLDFPFPSGSTIQSPVINKLAEGILASGPELESARKHALTRGVLLAASRMVGAGDDAAKARDAFKATPAKISSETFYRAMAQSSLDAADLFSSLKLDIPDRYKFFCDHAMELTRKLPDSKETKELIAKIQAAAKKGKKT